MSFSIKSLINETERQQPPPSPFAWTPHRQPEPAPKVIAPHVFEAHEAAKRQRLTDPTVLAHTAPVSPGLALAAYQASEEARTAPKPPRKGMSYSITTHGFKSYRITLTRHF